MSAFTIRPGTCVVKTIRKLSLVQLFCLYAKRVFVISYYCFELNL